MATKKTTAKKTTTAGAEPTAEEQVFGLRRGEPGTVYTYTTPQGDTVDVTADDAGVVTPKNQTEATVFDNFGLAHVKQVRDGRGGTTTRVVEPAPIEPVAMATAGAEVTPDTTPAPTPETTTAPPTAGAEPTSAKE